MRRLAWLLVVAVAAPAAADPKPADPKPAPCKKRFVGKGLERKAVCDLGEITLKQDAPKPNVMIVPRDGKAVVGRPKTTDPFKGLDRRLR